MFRNPEKIVNLTNASLFFEGGEDASLSTVPDNAEDLAKAKIVIRYARSKCGSFLRGEANFFEYLKQFNAEGFQLHGGFETIASMAPNNSLLQVRAYCDYEKHKDTKPLQEALFRHLWKSNKEAVSKESDIEIHYEQLPRSD